MTTSPTMNALIGRWHGPSKLWLMPGAPVRESQMEATIEPLAQGQFATIRCTWADEGQPQDGLLIVRHKEQTVKMIWIDSWHTGGDAMQFTGDAEADGRLTALGSYSAPEGPDWGWRIVIVPQSEDRFLLQMVNITPDGDEMLAVETPFTRR